MKKNLSSLLEDLHAQHHLDRLKAINFLADQGDSHTLKLLHDQLKVISAEKSALEKAIAKLTSKLKGK